MMNKSDTPRSFEDAMQELDDIVEKMETGELPLDDMLTAYKRGAELARFCRDKLNKTQLEIKKLENDELTDCTDEYA